jgi:hypothetical protein
MKIKKLLLLLWIATIFVACTDSKIKDIPLTASLMIERVYVPFREHGYSTVYPKVITTQEIFDSFLAEINEQNGWNNKVEFISVLKNAKIDFSKRNILLYRITETSGSVDLYIQEPVLSKDKSRISVQIDREVPDIGTSDMAYYALVYSVDKRIKEIAFKYGQELISMKNK